MVSLRITTWNARGLRMAERRKEILPLLGTMPDDVVVLQETHLVNEQQRSQAQKLWTKGPSVWSYGEEGQAGVAVLFKARQDLHVEFVLEALPGRLLIVDFSLVEILRDGKEQRRPFRLCGLYAPVAASRRKTFWAHLKGYCSTYRHLLIAGDFNNRSKLSDYSNYVVREKSGKKSPSLTPEERLLENFLLDHNLKDKALEVDNQLGFFPLPCKKAFFHQYGQPGSGKFTCYQKGRASRLDRIRAPADLKILDCQLSVTPWSDHVMLSMELALGEIHPRGKPLWRLRPKTIRDAACKEEIAAVLANMLTLEDLYFGELSNWWERVKKVIRKTCRHYEYVINRKDLQNYQVAVHQFLKWHQKVNQGLPVNQDLWEWSRGVIRDFQTRQKMKKKNYQDFRTKGAVVDIEEWARARSPQASIVMGGLRRCEKDSVRLDPAGMLNVMQDFYGELYQGQNIGGGDIEGFFDKVPETVLRKMYQGLSQQDRDDLVAPVTEKEVQDVIAQGRSKSAPGPDGLGWSFYKTFARWLVPPLTRVLNELLSRESLTNSFYEGILIFFPKQGDLTLPQNWRPIALTNVDYRILAKVLNNRLTKLASRIVLASQTSAVPGRRMLDSLCLFREVFHLARKGKWEGKILLLDQTKAFDRVHHPFMWEALARKGLPLDFVRYVQLLYLKARVIPQINGHRGAPIRVSSGVRQGCPLSPLLYVLILDSVLCQIQAQERITGLRVPPPSGGIVSFSGEVSVKRVKYAAHADDVSLFVNNREEIVSILNVFEGYERASGAQINLQKSHLISFFREEEILFLSPVNAGAMTGETQGENESVEKLEEYKMLGLLFSIKPFGWEKNWQLWLEKMKAYFEKWKPWKLNVYQKAVYIKSYLMPLALNLAAVYPAPPSLLKEAEKRVFRFLWGTAAFPLPRAVAFRKTEQGGLNLPALRLKFLATFLSQNFGKFSQWFRQRTGLEGWVALFAEHWVKESWAEKWWREEPVPFRVTAAMRHAGPDFLREVYGQIQQNGVLAEWFKTKGGSMRDLKRYIYWETVDVVFFQPQLEKNAKKDCLSAYLKEVPRNIECFTDRRIPFGLWDIRWRFYHQIYYLKGNQPWLKETEQICPRLLCQRQASVSASRAKETTEHFIKDCPSARETWKKIAAALDWPDLARQPWEAVASGLEPETRVRGPHRHLGEKRKRGHKGRLANLFWVVPWSTVRLVNLYVLLALVFQRKKELVTQTQADVNVSVRFVANKVKTLSETERGRMSSKRWKEFWPWLAETAPGMT